MLKIEIEDELTDEGLKKVLSAGEVLHNDSVLRDGETFFDLLVSPEADFRKYPGGDEIAMDLSL